MQSAGLDLSLIAALNHAADSLGLYRAELARILRLLCPDVSDPEHLEKLLSDNKEVREQAERFVYFHALLEAQFPDNSTGMVHWFRKKNVRLSTTPFHAMVDHGRLEDVIAELAEHAGQRL